MTFASNSTHKPSLVLINSKPSLEAFTNSFEPTNCIRVLRSRGRVFRTCFFPIGLTFTLMYSAGRRVNRVMKMNMLAVSLL